MMDNDELLALLNKGTEGPLQASQAVRQLLMVCEAGGMPSATGIGGASTSHPPVLGTWLSGLPSPTDFFTVPDIPLLTAAGTPNAEGEARLDFNGTGKGGWVVGIRGSIVDAAALGVDRSSIELELRLNQGEHIVTDGDNDSPILYEDLFSAQQQTWSPILRWIGGRDTWTFTFRNLSSVGNVQPTVSVAFIRSVYPGTDPRTMPPASFCPWPLPNGRPLSQYGR